MIVFEEDWLINIKQQRHIYEESRQKFQNDANRSTSDDLSIDNPLSLADDVIYFYDRVHGNNISRMKN